MDLFSTNCVQGALQDRGSSQASFGNAAVQLGESEDTRAEEGMAHRAEGTPTAIQF